MRGAPGISPWVQILSFLCGFQPKNRLAHPPWELTPPLQENLGSATESIMICDSTFTMHCVPNFDFEWQRIVFVCRSLKYQVLKSSACQQPTNHGHRYHRLCSKDFLRLQSELVHQKGPQITFLSDVGPF